MVKRKGHTNYGSFSKEELKYNKTKFPDCIGRFPECRDYHKDMPLENRSECLLCPFRGK